MKGLIPAIAALLACSTAVADQLGGKAAKAQPSFETLDKNADKQISRTEAGVDRSLSNGFALVDANGDGFLSHDEYAAREILSKR